METRRIIFRFFLIVVGTAMSFSVFFSSPLCQRGGWMMVPLIFASIFSFAIIFAKMRQFTRNTIDAAGFQKTIFECMERQRIKEAVDLCDKTDAPVARIIKAGILKYDRPKDDMKEAMQNEFLYEVPHLEEHLSLLSTVLDVVPLLGFVGTLSGFMKIFQVMEAKGASLVSLVPSDLAPGLWEALICSAASFLLVVPILIAHNYLVSRVKSFGETLEISATEFLEFIMERRMVA